MPTTADSSIAEVLVPVEHRRGLAARTPGLEPHTDTDTDTGHSNTVVDSNTDTDGNSKEEDKPGQFPLQCQWEDRCRFGFLLLPGPKTMTMRRWSGQHRRSKQFSPSWQLLLHRQSSTLPTFHYVPPTNWIVPPVRGSVNPNSSPTLQLSLSASLASRHNAERLRDIRAVCLNTCWHLGFRRYSLLQQWFLDRRRMEKPDKTEQVG